MTQELKPKFVLSIIGIAIILYIFCQIKILGMADFGLSLSPNEVFYRFLTLAFIGLTFGWLFLHTK